ncbi:hypothetical protein HY523_02540 [Candidatus Berkelbacteria bacterium]|nr:hypothetical protein [Candidatus Berkelbacteria bacterium]
MAKTVIGQQTEQSIRTLIRTIVREEIEDTLDELKEDRLAEQSPGFRASIAQARQEKAQSLTLEDVRKRYDL